MIRKHTLQEKSEASFDLYNSDGQNILASEGLNDLINNEYFKWKENIEQILKAKKRCDDAINKIAIENEILKFHKAIVEKLSENIVSIGSVTR